MIFLGALLLAMLLHVVLGWPWSILGGVAAGVASTKTGWLLGMVAVGMSWSMLILYNFVVAPDETSRFLTITGGLFGNMSGPTLVVVTVSLGLLLGLLGGVIGSLLRSIVGELNQRRRA